LEEEKKEELAIFNRNYENFILSPPEVITKGEKAGIQTKMCPRKKNNKFKV